MPSLFLDVDSIRPFPLMCRPSSLGRGVDGKVEMKEECEKEVNNPCVTLSRLVGLRKAGGSTSDMASLHFVSLSPTADL